MADCYESIRIYDIENNLPACRGFFRHIEFVYKSGVIKDFIKRHIISDEYAWDSKAGDRKIANRPQDLYDFIYCLEKTNVDEATGTIKVSYMKPITQEVVDGKGPLYEEIPYQGSLQDVLALARETLVMNHINSQAKVEYLANFDNKCKTILAAKLVGANQEIEPCSE